MKRVYRSFRRPIGGKGRQKSGAVTFGYSTRAAGYPDFYERLSKSGPLAIPDQTHSDRVMRVSGRVRNASGRLAVPDCDALITTDRGQLLTVRTADCLPVFFWDEAGRAVALAHAGWKGTHQKIAEKTVKRLVRLGVNPRRLRVVLGPCIRSCCYEVGPEFATRFEPETLKSGPNGRLWFDLSRANRIQLVKAGIPDAHIRDLKLCTACDTKQFFSFRREPGNPGRMIHWIVKN